MRLRPSALRQIESKLVPELKLHLLSPQDQIWNEEWKGQTEKEPFWAIFWPGGQVLSRYLLDSQVAKGKRGLDYNFFSCRPFFSIFCLVLDIGCGCGAQGIAALKTEAAKVTFNDLDTDALEAVIHNNHANSINPQ